MHRHGFLIVVAICPFLFAQPATGESGDQKSASSGETDRSAGHNDTFTNTPRSAPPTIPPAIFASAKTFLGTQDNDWFNAENWENGALPDKTDPVIVTGDCRIGRSYPYATCAALWVDDGVTLSVDARGSIRVAGPIITHGAGMIQLNNGGALAAPRNTFWIWIVIGFTGQIAFTGRMVVQWIASERAKKSVVPRLFWFLSLAGSVLLLSYAIYRKDIVIISGQALGSFIYVRNLVLGKQKKN